MNNKDNVLKDLKDVYREANYMGCTEVRKFEHVKLSTLKILIDALEQKEVPQWIKCSDRMPCGWCKKFDMQCDEVVNGKKNAQTKEAEQNEAK